MLSISELISNGDYRSVANNEIFYNNTTLTCATNDTSQQIQWIYRPTQIADTVNITSASSWNADTGVSVLNVLESMQGYYRCEVIQTSYDIAIFNPANTISEFIHLFE